MDFKLTSLSNTYTNLINSKELSHKLLMKKSKDNVEEMKRNVQQLKLGEDSKVDEAIMVTFFTSVFKDVTKAYNAFMLYKAENQLNTLKEKQESLNKFIELNENINKYTQLNIKRTALEKKLNEENLTSNEKSKHEKDLTKVLEDMENISDFFGYANDPDFTKNLEISEEKWYGKAGAEYLRDIRNLVPETLGEFRDVGVLNSQELSIDEILNNGVLDNSMDKIKEKLIELDGINTIKDLISKESDIGVSNNLEQK